MDIEYTRETDRQCSLDALKTWSNPVVRAVIVAHKQGIPWEKLWSVAEVGIAPLVEVINYTEDPELLSLDFYLRAARESFERCGSPIEQVFLAYVVHEGVFAWTDRFDSPQESMVGCWPYINVEIHSQLKIEKYRTDFAFVGPKRKLIVELDGHEFHERNKSQAERDKSRDRDLQSLGWSVFRFTGSEVWRDPQSCARQVILQFVDKEPAPTQ